MKSERVYIYIYTYRGPIGMCGGLGLEGLGFPKSKWGIGGLRGKSFKVWAFGD